MGLKNKLHKLSKDIDGEHFQNSTKKKQKTTYYGSCMYLLYNTSNGRILHRSISDSNSDVKNIPV